jgi:hypothetical protein
LVTLVRSRTVAKVDSINRLLKSTI